MRNCPLCGGGGIGEFLAAGNFRLEGCPECGLLFRLPYEQCLSAKCSACPDKCIDRLEDSDYLSLRLSVERRRLERINRLAGGISGLRVLEIGAGIGALSSLLSGAALDYRGTEASPLFFNQALASFPFLKEKISNSVFPAESPEKFDLAVAVDVIQFVPRPADFLSRLSGHLKPGGLIYVEVPDEKLLKFRAKIRAALGLYSGSPVHPGHINFFSERPLKKLFSLAGFEPLRISQATIAGDADRLALTLKTKPGPGLRFVSALARLSRLDILFRQGNLVALARK